MGHEPFREVDVMEKAPLEYEPSEQQALPELVNSDSISEGPESLELKRKGKVFIVDGPNQFHMQLVNGMASIDLLEFLSIVQNEIGTAGDFARKPVYTFTERMPKSLRSALRSSGFDIFETTSVDSRDDEVIRNLIASINPHDVGEVVLASANFGDFRDQLITKAEQGIEIFIFATTTLNSRTKTSMVSTAALDFIEQHPRFHFIELADYKERILRSVWIERGQRGIINFPLPGFDDEEARIELWSRVSEFVVKHGIRIANLQVGGQGAGISIEIPREAETFREWYYLLGDYFADYEIFDGQMKYEDPTSKS